MRPYIALRIVPGRRCGLLASVCAAVLLLPSISWATDPVENLRTALRAAPTGTGAEATAERIKRVKAAVAELRTINQKRRSYFLTEWAQFADDKKAPGPDKKDPLRDEMERQRTAIGDDLKNSIIEAARVPGEENRLSLGILIAEIAEADKSIELRARKGKFARGLTPVVADLIKAKEDVVRQTGLNALGKLTPDPRVAMPIIDKVLAEDSVGPRRLAAYALIDLARNSQHHDRAEELELVKDVVTAAAKGLRDASERGANADEAIRAYCVQAIQEAARVIAEKFSTEPALLAEPGAKKKMTQEQAEVMKAFQTANPLLVESLADPKLKVRLTALQALEQIGIAQARIKKYFDGPDPLENVVKGDWKEIAKLMKDAGKDDPSEDRVRLRRGAMGFFEQLGAEAEPAGEVIAQALRDEDRFVRWAATRAIRNLPPESVSSQAIVALAFHLLIDNDPDLSGAAADALETFGPRAQEAVQALGIVISNGGEDNRSWDVENRIKAMTALVSIGTPPADAKADERAQIIAKSQSALPQVLIALRDPDVRIRREAAQTVSLLGRPDDAQLGQRLVAELRRLLSDSSPEVRSNAAEAIVTLSTPLKK